MLFLLLRVILTGLKKKKKTQTETEKSKEGIESPYNPITQV